MMDDGRSTRGYASIGAVGGYARDSPSIAIEADVIAFFFFSRSLSFFFFLMFLTCKDLIYTSNSRNTHTRIIRDIFFFLRQQQKYCITRVFKSLLDCGRYRTLRGRCREKGDLGRECRGQMLVVLGE